MQTLNKIIELVGAPGNAVGSVSFGIAPCRLRGVQVVYTGQGAATPVVVVTTTLDALVKTVFTLTGNVDFPLATVGELLVDDTGSPIALAYIAPVLSGQIDIDVTAGDADAEGVTIWLVVEG